MKTRLKSKAGFSLLELVLVIAIMAVAMALVGLRTGTFDYWKEQTFTRSLLETLTFLHEQAVIDQEYYRLEFDFETNSYRVGTMKSDSMVSNVTSSGAGYLSDELAAFLSPSLGDDQTMIPPPSFPSLAEPHPLPGTMRLTEIKTASDVFTADSPGEKPAIIFSPRGFSDFAVIHIKFADGSDITVLVNPWTGIPKLYNEYKDFSWKIGAEN